MPRFSTHRTFDQPQVEEWRAIPGYVGKYEVSNLGRVRSLSRVCKSRNGERPVPPRVLKASPMRTGYLAVCLGDGQGKRTKAIHQLVLLGFVGPRADGFEACHGDGVKTNNNLNNLRYDTKEANYRDRDRHGNLPRGVNHPSAKLTPEAVRDIRIRRAAGEAIETVAAIYQISQAAVSFVTTRRTWRHI